MKELQSKFTKLQSFGYLFILLLIILSFSGIGDSIAIALMDETQQSTAIYALLLKTIAASLTFIPDNDALAPFIDTFDRAGTLLFIASVTITLQKITLILLQAPTFSIIMLVMLISVIANKLTNIFNYSFTLLVQKYLIILLLIRFFITATAILAYGAVGTILENNDKGYAKRTEELNINIKKITESKDLIKNFNDSLQKEIETLDLQIKSNCNNIEDIGTKWISQDDPRVTSLQKKNTELEDQKEILENEQVEAYEFIDSTIVKMEVAIAQIQVWFKNIFEGIFTALSIILIKIVIFPFISFIAVYKLGRTIIGNDTVYLIKNTFKKG